MFKAELVTRTSDYLVAAWTTDRLTYMVRDLSHRRLSRASEPGLPQNELLGRDSRAASYHYIPRS